MKSEQTHPRFHPGRFGAALAALLCLGLLFASAASADYEQVGNFAQSGNGEQFWSNVSGMSVNVNGAGGVEPGSVYASTKNRVSRYNAKGEIEEVWGWNTIASGPDLPNQVSALEVNATSGTYVLRADTAKGVTDTIEGSNVFTNLWTETGSYHVGDEINRGIPGGVSLDHSGEGATITAVGPDTVEASAASLYSSYDKAGARNRRLLYVDEFTAPIPYNASAAEVQEALLALPAFGPGDVLVSGAPGDYEISFAGAYAGTPVELESSESTLAGGTASATVATVVEAFTPGFQRCRPGDGDVCVAQELSSAPGELGVGAFTATQGISVDQSTGNVYVVNGAQGRAENLIEVFSADGSEVIARFGATGPAGQTERLHEFNGLSRGVAVDDSGRIYLGDIASGKYRVMCFRPQSPGDYQHYVYCGSSQDLKTVYPLQVALDDAGHLYVAEQGLVEERSPAEPSAPALCTYLTHGQLVSMTVNPLTGEVFYFNSSGNDRSVHRLKPCDPAKGQFEEAQARVKPTPATEEIYALAVNPSLSWGPERPAGVLYAGDLGNTAHGTQRGIGDIFAPAKVHSPTILSESFSNTRTSSTVLHAEINPNGFGTRYVFQYLSEEQYEANAPTERFAGAAEVPAGGGEIGGGSVGQASTAISTLAPDTAYRFRVIATSECNGEGGELCVSEGEALAFTTYPLYPPGLPDHRAYELVSPAQKHGGEVVPAEPGVASCVEDRETGGCKPNTHAAALPMQSSPDGEALAFEGLPFNPAEGAVDYDSYVSRRTTSGWQTTALLPAQPPSGILQLAFDPGLNQGLLGLSKSSLALQPTSQPGSLTPLVSEAPNRGDELKLSYGGHSSDFSRIFFAANDSLTKATASAPEPPDPGVSKNDLYEWHEGRLAVVNVLPGNGTIATGAKFASISPDTHAVSEDGAKVYFEDEAGALYVRENGEVTKPIDDPAHFLSASPDGSEALLTNGCIYSLVTESCTDLTAGKGGFQGILGQSGDLSHIYFVDTAVLAENVGSGLDSKGSPQVAEAGESNLYEWSGGEPRFIAQLIHSAESGVVDSADWAANPAERTAESSADGRFLAFTSTASLTGYNNVGPCGFGTGEEGYPVRPAPCVEAFLYDSDNGHLVCASCNPTGEAPLGQTHLRRIYGFPAEFPQPRYLTDEGRLYLDTQDSLSARDTNEGVEDVYEFSPRGTGAEGTCEREAGCAFLISAGTEGVDSNLIAVDETGKNVFFDTRDKLALKDKDELLDVYDAREGGGIAAEAEVARGECQGENCQVPAQAPIDPTPGSSTFSGAGNVKPETKAKKHSKKHKKHSKKHKAKKHARATKRNHGGAK